MKQTINHPPLKVFLANITSFNIENGRKNTQEVFTDLAGNLDINFLGEFFFFDNLSQTLQSMNTNSVHEHFIKQALTTAGIEIGKFASTPAARTYHRLKKHQEDELISSDGTVDTCNTNYFQKHRDEKAAFLKAVWGGQDFDINQYYREDASQSVKITADPNFDKGQVTVTFNLSAENFDAIHNSPELSQKTTEVIARQTSLGLAEILSSIYEGESTPSAKDYLRTISNNKPPEIIFEKPEKGDIIIIRMDLSTPFKDLVNPNKSVHGHSDRFDHRLLESKLLETLNRTISNEKPDIG